MQAAVIHIHWNKLWTAYAFLGVEYLNSRVIKPVQIKHKESNTKPIKGGNSGLLMGVIDSNDTKKSISFSRMISAAGQAVNCHFVRNNRQLNFVSGSSDQ